MKRSMRIFIGTSTKYAPKNSKGEIDRANTDGGERLSPIFEAISAAGHIAIPWWSNKVWHIGDSFWDNVIRASKVYDGGVFLFGRDDPIKNSHNGHQLYVARGNVLIEFGLFRASKGKHRTLAVFDHSNTRSALSQLVPPSDLSGIVFPSLNDADLKERVTSFFRSNNDTQTFEEVTLYKGRSIASELLNKKYREWKTKGLFVGMESAILWDKIEGNSGFDGNISLVNEFLENFEQSYSEEYLTLMNSIDNMISFRPGNGKTDRSILDKFFTNNSRLSYIPVDFNSMMVFKTIENVSRNGMFSIPFAIIDDFEVNYAHIKSIIERKSHEIGRRNLFVMLSVTFSNLEGSERTFFNKMKMWMDGDDYFLFDILLHKDDEETNENVLPQSSELLDEFARPTYRNLLINSIVKKYMKKSESDGWISEELPLFERQELADLEANIGNYVTREIINEDCHQIYTVIPNTIIAAYKFKKGNKDGDILVAKAYRYDLFLMELKKHFEVIDSMNGLTDSVNNMNRGIFLVKTKSTSMH